MANVTEQYVQSLEPIYRDILAMYPEIDPARKKGSGLAYQSLYTALSDKYGLGEIKAACEQMAAGGAMEIRLGYFAHPTELGEEIIAKLTGGTVPPVMVPPFAPPKS